LESAVDEAEKFARYFKTDLIIDDDEIYFIGMTRA